MLQPLVPVRRSPKLPTCGISSSLTTTPPTWQLHVCHRRNSFCLALLHELWLSGLGHDFAYPQIFGKRNSM